MDALSAIHLRHGVLRFQDRLVEPALIQQVLEAAVAAPSPANLQPWAFIVVTQAGLARQVAHYLIRIQQEKVFTELLENPPADTTRLMDLYEGFDRAPCFILVCLEPKNRFARPEHAAVLRDWYLACLGAAMQNLMVAATALGLGTRWFGGFALDAGGEFLQRLLAIPPVVEIVAVTPLGYSNEPSKERSHQESAAVSDFRRGDPRALRRLLRGRLSLDGLVHYDQW